LNLIKKWIFKYPFKNVKIIQSKSVKYLPEVTEFDRFDISK